MFINKCTCGYNKIKSLKENKYSKRSVEIVEKVSHIYNEIFHPKNCAPMCESLEINSK